MATRKFRSVREAADWLASPEFDYPTKVSTIDGRKGVAVFRLSKAETERYLPLRRRLKSRALKDALFSVVKESGADAASTFYHAKKGNVFSALKSTASLFKSLWTVPDEEAWERRLEEQDPDLYEVHRLQERFRRLALFSFRHVKDVIEYDQSGPVYAGEFYDGKHQIFYLKLSR